MSWLTFKKAFIKQVFMKWRVMNDEVPTLLKPGAVKARLFKTF